LPINVPGEVAGGLLRMPTLQGAGLRKFGIGVAALKKKDRADGDHDIVSIFEYSAVRQYRVALFTLPQPRAVL